MGDAIISPSLENMCALDCSMHSNFLWTLANQGMGRTGVNSVCILLYLPEISLLLQPLIGFKPHLTPSGNLQFQIGCTPVLLTPGRTGNPQLCFPDATLMFYVEHPAALSKPVKKKDE